MGRKVFVSNKYRNYDVHPLPGAPQPIWPVIMWIIFNKILALKHLR